MAQHFEKSFAKLRSQNNPHVTPFKKYFEKCVKKYSQGFAPLFQKVDFQKWIQIVDLLLTVRIVLINEVEQ
jgi:hypothetical protein